MNKAYDAPAEVIGDVVRTLIETQLAKVTSFQSPSLTVKATRVMFAGRLDSRDKRADVRVTIGAPNYAERKFIKACKRAGEPFPIKKLQLKDPPKKKCHA